ncbi:hypothetical protein [Amycolatopsis sp. cmx-4-61]|uniref:hypothetical protein n=1 Tax=Amycolatopsis sp. cmx-4-61 TaxID=2790937 RepID=UPI00397AADDA
MGKLLGCTLTRTKSALLQETPFMADAAPAGIAAVIAAIASPVNVDLLAMDVNFPDMRTSAVRTFP